MLQLRDGASMLRSFPQNESGDYGDGDLVWRHRLRPQWLCIPSCLRRMCPPLPRPRLVPTALPQHQGRSVRIPMCHIVASQAGGALQYAAKAPLSRGRYPNTSLRIGLDGARQMVRYIVMARACTLDAIRLTAESTRLRRRRWSWTLSTQTGPRILQDSRPMLWWFGAVCGLLPEEVITGMWSLLAGRLKAATCSGH